jgi:hypothetical protein
LLGSIFHSLSNKIGFTSFGVSLQKLLLFFCLPGSTARGVGTTIPHVFAFAEGVVLLLGSTGPLPARLDLLPLLLFF